MRRDTVKVFTTGRKVGSSQSALNFKVSNLWGNHHGHVSCPHYCSCGHFGSQRSSTSHLSLSCTVVLHNAVQNPAPMGVPRKEPIGTVLQWAAQILLKIWWGSTETLQQIIKFPSTFLVSVVPPQCHLWLSPRPTSPWTVQALDTFFSFLILPSSCHTTPSTTSLPSSRDIAIHPTKRTECCHITIGVCTLLQLFPTAPSGPWGSQGHTGRNAEEPPQKPETGGWGGRQHFYPLPSL